MAYLGRECLLPIPQQPNMSPYVEKTEARKQCEDESSSRDQIQRRGHESAAGRRSSGHPGSLPPLRHVVARDWPPIRLTAETSGTCLIVSSTCAAMRRSSK